MTDVSLPRLEFWCELQCPDCRTALDDVRALRARYGDALTIELRHFPLEKHKHAYAAAEAAEEAFAQGKGWEYAEALLAETGAIPQIVAHDGRGPHIHVSRAAAAMADRITAHLAMGLAELLVAGESGRLRTCASPTCREVFLDESRNRSRRYCDSRTCGNRLHVAAYRARKAATG